MVIKMYTAFEKDQVSAKLMYSVMLYMSICFWFLGPQWPVQMALDNFFLDGKDLTDVLWG